MSTINLEQFKTIKDNALILDIRRDEDYQQSSDIIPGATWKNPAEMETWGDSLPKDQEIVLYCVRGGGVSKSVVSHLQSLGLNARYIEGGIEGVKEAGGEVTSK